MATKDRQTATMSPQAKEVIAELAERTKMSEHAITTRLVEWFGQQPDTLQRAILGMLGNLTPDIVKLILEQMAKSSTTTAGQDQRRAEAGGSGKLGPSGARKRP